MLTNITKMARDNSLEYLKQNNERAKAKAEKFDTKEMRAYATGYQSAVDYVEEMHKKEMDYEFFVNSFAMQLKMPNDRGLENVFEGYEAALKDNLIMLFKEESYTDEIEDEGIDRETLEDFSLLEDSEGEC